MTYTTSAAAGVVALIVAAATTPVAALAARHWDVLDKPGPLKPQFSAVPYFGGLAVGAGLLAAAVTAGSPLLLLAPVAALLLGLADDIRALRVVIRLPIEVGIGLGVSAAAGVDGTTATIVAAVFTVAVMNAVNFVDGMDGLACAVTAVAATGCAVLGDVRWGLLAAGLAGACLGFLLHNRPPARIYLGDAGSYLLGCTLALLLVHAAATHGLTTKTAGVLAVGAYPLAELTWTVLRRLRARQSPFTGDRGHVYDRLQNRGWSTGQTLSALTAAQSACVTVGVLVLWQRG